MHTYYCKAAPCALISILAIALSGAALAQSKNPIPNEAALKKVVSQQVGALMAAQQIPGMAVAVLWQGKTFYYSFGQADVAANRLVTPDTIFELGSISKTFAGVIGAMALERGEISLTDPVSKHWPQLTAKPWQQINMQHLATYTAGGLPLFMPDSVTDKTSLLAYYQQWQPQFPAGTQRVYANSSIGLFAHLAVAAGGNTYAEAFSQQLSVPLQLRQTFLQVPKSAEAHYAWGYNEGKAVRIGSGVLLDEAGGAKASVRDLASWLQANMQPALITSPVLRAGIVRAQQHYAKSGQMYQGLGWEMLDYPVSLSALTAATDPAFVQGSAATFIYPATALQQNSWVHKTGATGGFGAYAAFIPSRQVGIVLLANKRYPNSLRVKLAYQVLENLQ
jgi:beta-lactamase class C ACT/MIR